MMYDSASVELTGALVCCSTFSFLGGGEKAREGREQKKKITGDEIKSNLHIQYGGKGQSHEAA